MGSFFNSFLQPLEKKKTKTPTKKLLLTLFLLFLFRLGNTIPLEEIDQEALTKTLAQMDSTNPFLQLYTMYSGGKTLNFFSLGLIPFINASILIDLLTTLIPSLEKLQTEEGERGRKQIFFYKKIIAFFFALFEAGVLVSYLQPFFYNAEFSTYIFCGLELITGSFLLIWFSTLIDTKGIGNGTSLLIFINIISSFFSKMKPLFFDFKLSFLKGEIFSNISFSFFLEVFVLLFFIFCITLLQLTRMNIEIVSSKQLLLLEEREDSFYSKNVIEKEEEKQVEKREKGLSIRLTQAGIFPIIIASNLLPFLSSFFRISNSLFLNVFYYLLILIFNYFYTTLFWDPEKISEQLRKASVSVTDVSPGKETISYLENAVRASSLFGGLFLCCILASYDFLKDKFSGDIIKQLNISSLIIVVGVAYELKKTLESLYQAEFQKVKQIK